MAVKYQPQNKNGRCTQHLHTRWRCSPTCITEVLMNRKKIRLTSAWQSCAVSFLDSSECWRRALEKQDAGQSQRGHWIWRGDLERKETELNLTPNDECVCKVYGYWRTSTAEQSFQLNGQKSCLMLGVFRAFVSYQFQHAPALKLCCSWAWFFLIYTPGGDEPGTASTLEAGGNS